MHKSKDLDCKVRAICYDETFNPIQYGLFLKHYSMGGGGIMAPPCNFAVS